MKLGNILKTLFLKQYTQQGKTEELRHTRFAIGLAVLLFSLGIIYMPIFIFFFNNYISALAALLLSTLTAISWWHFRLYGRQIFFKFSLFGIMFIVQSINTYSTGGISSPLITGYLIVPLTALFLNGIRSSVRWTFATCVIVFVFSRLYTTGYTITTLNNNNFSKLFLSLTVIFIIMLVVLLQHFVYKLNIAAYSKSHLSKLNIEELDKKIEIRMRQEKIFLRENLKINNLAASLEITTHQLSEYLNSYKNQSFNQFILAHRLTEVEYLLKNEPDKKIIDIAYKCGFNSLSAFYKAFHQKTGVNPQQYKEINHNSCKSAQRSDIALNLKPDGPMQD